MTIPTFLFLNFVPCCNKAAKPVAPAPSTTIFSCSANIAIALSIDLSETVKTSSTKSFNIEKGISPISATAIPSAKVEPLHFDFLLNILLDNDG